MNEWITDHPWLALMLAVLLIRAIACPRVVVINGTKSEKP
jgi:hypothetical protein